MCTVCPQYGAAVFAVQLFEPAKPAVDVHIVNEEIGEAIKRNANTDKQHPEIRGQTANHVTDHTRNSKNEKKAIVLLKKALFFVLRQVMVFVPVAESGPAIANAIIDTATIVSIRVKPFFIIKYPVLAS